MSQCVGYRFSLFYLPLFPTPLSASEGSAFMLAHNVPNVAIKVNSSPWIPGLGVSQM